MKWISAAVVICCMCVGCGDVDLPQSEPLSEEGPRPVSTKSVPSAPLALIITEKPLSDPLTRDEVAAFVELVDALPGRRPPELNPVASSPDVQGLRIDAAIHSWRSAVRDALTVETLVRGWSPQTSVRRLMTEKRVPARAMLSLMLRLSCSISIEAMGGHRQVAAQRILADEKIEQIVARISQLNRQKQPIPDSYWQSLEEACSMAEYLAVLSDVSPENEAVIAEMKAELTALLPHPTNLKRPIETHEDNHIEPVRFEQISESSQRSSR